VGQRIVLDYSFARPSPSQIKAAGAVGVVRYLSHDRHKAIDAGELHALLTVGLQVALVWEDGARAAAAGYPQGVSDGRDANAQADALNWPDDRPIYFAIDYDVAGDTATPVNYLRGCAAGSKRPVRGYGSLEVVEAARGAQFGAGWQTLAWSHGMVSPHAVLIQTTRPAPVADTDVNVIGDGFTDWGQHPAPTGPHPGPTLNGADMIYRTEDGRLWLALVKDGQTHLSYIHYSEWTVAEPPGTPAPAVFASSREWLTGHGFVFDEA
jgi:hypothetical protein